MRNCERCKELEATLRRIQILATRETSAAGDSTANITAAKAKTRPRDRAYGAADYLRRKILEAKPNHKLGRGKWEGSRARDKSAAALDKLERIDGRSWADIARAVDWLFTVENTFVVFCGDSLRKKIDNIEIAMRRDQQRVQQPRERTPEEEGFRVL